MFLCYSGIKDRSFIHLYVAVTIIIIRLLRSWNGEVYKQGTEVLTECDKGPEGQMTAKSP